jgi:hypothetical protein
MGDVRPHHMMPLRDTAVAVEARQIEIWRALSTVQTAANRVELDRT